MIVRLLSFKCVCVYASFFSVCSINLCISSNCRNTWKKLGHSFAQHYLQKKRESQISSRVMLEWIRSDRIFQCIIEHRSMYQPFPPPMDVISDPDCVPPDNKTKGRVTVCATESEHFPRFPRGSRVHGNNYSQRPVAHIGTDGAGWNLRSSRQAHILMGLKCFSPRPEGAFRGDKMLS